MYLVALLRKRSRNLLTVSFTKLLGNLDRMKVALAKEDVKMNTEWLPTSIAVDVRCATVLE